MRRKTSRYPAPQRRKKSIVLKVFLLILVIGLIVGIVVGIGYWRGWFDSDTETTSTPNTESYTSWGKTTTDRVAIDSPNNYYVCKADYNGKTMSGKSINDANCNISYGNVERSIAQFDYLLTNKTVDWTKNPANKVVAGKDGTSDLYVCRAKDAGGVYHGGKATDKTCWYGLGGKEIRTEDFEYLSLS